MVKTLSKLLQKHPYNQRFWLGIYIIITLLTMNLVFAAEFDNVITKPSMTFDNKDIKGNTLLEKYPPLKIENWFGIGKTLAEAYIYQHDFTCGTECSSTIEIKLYEKAPLVQDVIFYTVNIDRSKTEQEIRSYQFYIKTGEEEYVVDDTFWTCSGTGEFYINGTEKKSCSYVKIGSHTETKPIWKEYNMGEEVSAGTYEIKLEGKKKLERTVDWQIKTNGIWIEDWADWGASSLGNNLIHYWKLDDGNSLVVKDENNLANGTKLAGSPKNQSGLILSAYNFTNSSSTVNYSNTYIKDLNRSFAINFWVYGRGADTLIDLTGCSYLSSQKYPSGGAKGWAITSANGETNAIEVTGWGSEYGCTGRIVLNRWNMVTINILANNTEQIYVDGAMNCSAVITASLNASSGLAYLGSMVPEDQVNASLDEVGIWNRTLTASEITQLYNGGAGFPYEGGTQVTLNSPADNNFTNSNSVTFNCSATITGGATLVNMSLWINKTGTWILNTTQEKTGTSNTSIFTNIYPEQKFSWTCQACDNDGECGFAGENRTVIIDTSAPIITINKPKGVIFSGGGNEYLNWSVVDTNLDKMWYNYNGTNITVTGAINQTTFQIDGGYRNLTFWANDTLNHVSSAVTNWSYTIFITPLSLGYEPDTYETKNELFIMDIYYNKTLFPVIESKLVYSGKSYSSYNIYSITDYDIFEADIDIPLINSSCKNNSFYWQFNLIDENDTSYSIPVFEYGTTLYNQSVCQINLGECNNTRAPALNITAYDQLTLNRTSPFNLKGTINYSASPFSSVTRQYNFTNISILHKDVCINPNITYYLSGFLEYSNTSYQTANYYFINYTLNDLGTTPVVIKDLYLYLLPIASSTSFIFLVQDQDFFPLQNYYVYIYRYNPGNPVPNLVQIAKTDTNGQSLGFLETETVDYKFMIYDTFGNLVYTTDHQKAIPQSTPYTITFTIGSSLPNPLTYLDNLTGLTYSLTYNKDTYKAVFTYTDTNASFTKAFLVVSKANSSGADSILCNKSSAINFGAITCDMAGNSTGSYYATVYIKRGATYLIDRILFEIENFTETVGMLGVLGGWLIILICASLFVYNEIAGIWATTIGVIFVNIIGLVHFGGIAITAILGIAIFLSVVLERS